MEYDGFKKSTPMAGSRGIPVGISILPRLVDGSQEFRNVDWEF